MLDHAVNFLNGFRCIVMATYYWLVLIQPKTRREPWRGRFFKHINGVDWYSDKGFRD